MSYKSEDCAVYNYYTLHAALIPTPVPPRVSLLRNRRYVRSTSAVEKLDRFHEFETRVSQCSQFTTEGIFASLEFYGNSIWLSESVWIDRSLKITYILKSYFEYEKVMMLIIP